MNTPVEHSPACPEQVILKRSDMIVLCVDDEQAILNSLTRLLRRETYRLLTATSGDDGLQLLREHSVQVVLADQRMPGMTGIRFLQEVKKLAPDTVRVILSGYSDVNVVVDAINQGEVYRFLTKPWNDDELKTAVRQCLEYWELAEQNRLMVRRIQQQNKELQSLNDHLEDRVLQRTRSLQFAQDVVQSLPLPVFGVDPDGIIVLVNAALGARFPGPPAVVPGLKVRDVVPAPVADMITQCLQTPGEQKEADTTWQRVPVRARIQSLTVHNRGCLVLLETN